MYASVADLVEQFGETEIVELTDRDQAGEIDTAVAERALEDASAEIDGYLAARYRLPISEPLRLLTLLAADIARYRLQRGVATDQARQRYEDAVAMLKRIQSGQMNMPLATRPPAVAEPMVVRSGGRVFDDDALKGW
ncbi:gp436 family protein [Bordetella hinzii]|uniref:gp436 family protein n=1 Tax=Bordetella hinzii TaxID=103855 RepID=UPI000764A5B9|nr:phage protein Gp36 family protein [Bordetella hinzii]KXA72494.1 hypothetical protein AXA74_12745 [Bordetella hinzii LMG 13501]VEH25213.1 Mu-like prophage protein gp36 [Bordetella hinzii]